MKLITLCFLVVLIYQVVSQTAPPTCTPTNLLPYSHIQSGYCPTIWASGLSGPRQVTVASNGDVLVLEASANRVTVLWDDNNDGVSSSSERAVLATYDELNHAVVIHDGYIYASNPKQVVRWPYQAGDRSNLGSPQLVIYDIPCCHHVTRTIRFDSNNLIYVQVGSGSNEDPDTTHARINRFDITSIPSGGINWNTGYVFANGLRNEVGVRFDAQGRLWGVENGVDSLYRADLGGDISNGNPAEELNYLGHEDEGGLFYGYPYCWSSFNLTGYLPGTQFVHENFEGVPPYSDDWCQNMTNVKPPKLAMDAHMAPLDILFWYSDQFPTVKSGDAFVAFHGSWDKTPPAGYRVDLVTYGTDGMPIINYPFLEYQGPGAYSSDWIRPVGLANATISGVDSLFVTSDATGQVILIQAN